jgi:squalene synthase HpnC
MKTQYGVTHYENFPVASVLCPPRLRPAVSAIYWFARTADDLADEGQAPASQRLADLAAFKADLHHCAAQRATSGRWDDVFRPLQPVLQAWRLPLSLLEDLLSAFEQDVVKQHYDSQSELLDYCRRSANPIGRLLLHLYGVQAPAALAQSDCICTALQLINFWQDLSVDIPRGRFYVPADMAQRHGMSQTELREQQLSNANRALMAEALAWARDTMLRGAPLVKQVPGRASWELRLVVQGGLRIAEKIERGGHTSLLRRPRIGKADALLMAWRALWM